MTCILLSETHIAADHSVVSHCLPHDYTVDPTFRKIHIDPKKRFFYALTGTSDQAYLTDDAFVKAVRIVLIHFLIKNETDRKLDGILIPDEPKEFKDSIQLVMDVLGEKNTLLIVTKDNRWKVDRKYVADAFDVTYLQYRYCGKLFGMGSGGYYGMGLMRAGLPMKKIFPIVSTMDSLTSELFTSYPLSMLKAI